MDFAYARLLALPKDWQVEGRECEGLHCIYCLGRELFCVSCCYSSSSSSSPMGFEAFPRDLPSCFLLQLLVFSILLTTSAPSLL